MSLADRGSKNGSVFGEVATEPGDQTAFRRRQLLASWIAREVLPHEGRIRDHLRRSRLTAEDVDEVVQEAYCRLAMLDAVDHIACPHAYFFSIARNLMLRRLKRQAVVSFESIAELEALRDDTLPSPEDQVASRMAYEKVLRLIEDLPAKCRRIVELRKIEGWSQKEIAVSLGMTEKAVEKQVWMGVRAIRVAWDRAEQGINPAAEPDRRMGRFG